MVKKYFAKYLPVEGEIKEGDLYFQTYSEGQIGKANVDDCKDGAYKGYRKVKLFLCSRDIQVGDNVWDSHNGHYKADQMLVDLLTGPAIAALKEVPVKVIGEISPEATWVKEGDEFERNDLQAHGLGPNWNDSDTGLKFKIKGPCGHFH